ncbi:MAG: Sensory box histidine kinase, partial [Labilithrix sp.]|nr:Sensory box histidine kinase [Labilithrix sp.]
MKLARLNGGPAGVVFRFVIGAAFAAIGLGIEGLLWSNFPPTPFLLVYPAVVVAAWVGGWAGGIAAVLVSALALPYWFLPPTDSFAITARRDALDLAIFCVVATLLVGLISRVKRALHEAYAARRVAEAATAAKDTVLAIVAHDLRNPLQTIGLSTGLLGEAVPEQNERARTIVSRIDRCAERATRLVDNILDSARIDATPFPVETTVSSLSELVDESLSPFEPLADARSIKVYRPPEAALEGTIVCDRDRIVQVLSNLVGNAIK